MVTIPSTPCRRAALGPCLRILSVFIIISSSTWTTTSSFIQPSTLRYSQRSYKTVSTFKGHKDPTTTTTTTTTVLTAEESISSTISKIAKRKGSNPNKNITATSAAAEIRARKKPRKSTIPADPQFWVNPKDLTILNQTHVHCTIRGNPIPLRRHRTARGYMYNPSAAAQHIFQDTVRTCLRLSSLPIYKDSSSPYDEENSNTNNDDTDSTKTKKISSSSSTTTLSKTLIPQSHFGSTTAIRLTAMFYLARPKSHYKNQKIGWNRLKATAPMTIVMGSSGGGGGRQVDVDNLAKFVLDSLNGILYHDDHQVVSLTCTKCYDTIQMQTKDDGNKNEGDDDLNNSCRGKTVLWVQAITEDELFYS